LGFGLFFTNRNAIISVSKRYVSACLPCLGCTGMKKGSSYFDRARSLFVAYAALARTNDYCHLESRLPAIICDYQFGCGIIRSHP